MNNLDRQYLELLQDILDNGVLKEDRTGTGTLSVFGRQIVHKMSEGFPLLTTKKMAIKSMMTELKWFLRGGTNIKYLVDNGCNIWNGDAYKNYLNRNGKCYCGHTNTCDCGDITMEEFIEKIKTNDEFAEKWGELGPIYGKQWRNWTRRTTREEKIVNPGVYTKQIDQIKNLIEELKTNPDSRRLMVSAWNPASLERVVLPPCHYGFQVYTRPISQSERFQWYGNQIGSHMHHDHIVQEMNENNVPTRAISIMWNQRSVDVPLGLPFNIASYGTLLQLLAQEVNMIPDTLIGNLGDTHIYLNQIEGVNEQLQRKPYPLPTLELSNIDILNGEWDWRIDNYQSHSKIHFPLSN